MNICAIFCCWAMEHRFSMDRITGYGDVTNALRLTASTTLCITKNTDPDELFINITDRLALVGTWHWQYNRLSTLEWLDATARDNFFYIRNWSHIANNRLLLFLFLLGRPLQKSLKIQPFKSDRDEIWQDCSTHKYASTVESDFRFDVTLSRWRSWCHFRQKSVATWSASAYRLCRSVRHLYWFCPCATEICCCSELQNWTCFEWWNRDWSEWRTRNGILVVSVYPW